LAETLIISAICGIGIGLLSGILGVGGGVIVIPMLRLAFGVDALVTAGTSLLVILPTSLAGVIGRLRSRSRTGARVINLRAGLLVGCGGIVFSPIGSWLGNITGGPIVMIAAAIVIAYTGVNMIRKALKSKPVTVAASDRTETAEVASPTDVEADEAGSALDRTQKTEAMTKTGKDGCELILNGTTVAKLICLGAVAGLLSGFIGVGGGFLIIPMLMWMFDMPFKEASGTSLAALCILSIPGIVTHGLLMHVDYARGLAIAAGSIPGALLGTALLKRLPEKTLRIVFGALLFVVAVTLAVNEFI